MKFFTKDTQKVEITISNRTVLKVLALVFLTILLLAAIRQATHALTLIFIAFFLALALNSPVHWVASHLPGKRKGSRSLATAVAFFIVVLILGGLLASIVPPLIRQTSSFIDSVPGLVEDLNDTNTTLGRYVDRYNLNSQVDKISEQARSWSSDIAGGAISTVGRVGGSIASTLTVLVLTFMMLVEGPKWIKLGRRLTPAHEVEHVEILTRDMYRVIKGYVNGQVLLAAMAAILLLPVLIIMNVGYPFALMVVVFVCGLIPMVGHTIGAVLVSVAALFTSPIAALVVFGYYLLYQQIENYAVQPKIQSNSTDMSPLLVFSSVIIGVSFSGLLGGLVAIPLAGCLRILVLDYLNRKQLLDAGKQPVSKPLPNKA